MIRSVPRQPPPGRELIACALTLAVTVLISPASGAPARKASRSPGAARPAHGPTVLARAATAGQGTPERASTTPAPTRDRARPKRDVPRVAAPPALTLHPVKPLAAAPQPALPPMAPVSTITVTLTPIPIASPTPAPTSPEPTPTAASVPAPASAEGSTTPEAIPEVPDEQQVQTVIKQNLSAVRACHLRLQRGGIHITGKALVSFVIAPDGRPQQLQIEAPAFAGTTLPECVAQQLSRWQFPISRKGASFPITYPFVFVAGS